MGEILVSVFIGIWLTAAGVFAYRQLKKDYKLDDDMEKEGKKI